jgi:hypothetical protein
MFAFIKDHVVNFNIHNFVQNFNTVANLYSVKWLKNQVEEHQFQFSSLEKSSKISTYDRAS